jgi:phosphoribosylcarboxyaminoimidazole (NCAIR) mutase
LSIRLAAGFETTVPGIGKILALTNPEINQKVSILQQEAKSKVASDDERLRKTVD